MASHIMNYDVCTFLYVHGQTVKQTEKKNVSRRKQQTKHFGLSVRY